MQFNWFNCISAFQLFHSKVKKNHHIWATRPSDPTVIAKKFLKIFKSRKVIKLLFQPGIFNHCLWNFPQNSFHYRQMFQTVVCLQNRQNNTTFLKTLKRYCLTSFKREKKLSFLLQKSNLCVYKKLQLNTLTIIKEHKHRDKK